MGADLAQKPSIEILERTTFCGRRFTRSQLSEIQETVRMFPNLSRSELAATLCVHLNWTTPNGSNKTPSSLKFLEELEKHGVIVLPERRKSPARKRAPAMIHNAEWEPAIQGTLETISPIALRLVKPGEDRNAWKDYVRKYHYLGYDHAFGSHLCYWIESKTIDRPLGCLLFSAAAAWALAPRDDWIGWDEKHRRKLLHLILSNNRFLIFPWVDVSNLATKTLSLVTEQLQKDWATEPLAKLTDRADFGLRCWFDAPALLS
jgi:hypothetical protein